MPSSNMRSQVAFFGTVFLISSLLTLSLAQSPSNRTVAYYIPQVLNNSNYEPKRWKTAIGGQNFTWCCIQAVVESLMIDKDGNLSVAENPPIIGLNVSDLQQATNNDQFPCTAKYDSDKAEGAPEINVPYKWLADTCPGWALSSSNNLNGWLQPLSGFLLPAVIFCLSVPRRRKFHVFREFFVPDLAGIKSYVPALLGAVGAMIIVTIDTIVWLSVCWALSGPMILSGLYEALLDNRVIDFVRLEMQGGNLTIDMRCRLLMLVLIGNLDLALEDDPYANNTQHHSVIQGVSPSPSHSLPRPRSGTPGSDTLHQPLVSGERRSGEAAEHGKPDDGIPLEALSTNTDPEGEVGEIRRRPMFLHTDHLGISSADGSARGNSNVDHSSSYQGQQERVQQRTPDIRVEQADAGGIQRRPTGHLRASPWRHMEELLYPIRLYDDEDTDRNLSPRQYPKYYHRAIFCQHIICKDSTHFRPEDPHPRTAKIERQIHKTKTRLRTMLNCQYSFGSMVGAPVVFFLGGFVFALLQSIQSMGDEDTALALAFGQWYMIIPHIAIISGLLLAGNNPNILEGVFATTRQKEETDLKILGLNFGLAYPSCYKVAWQWHRGHNKLRWIQQVLHTYDRRSIDDQAGPRGVWYARPDLTRDLDQLRDKTTLSPLDWFLILFMATFLLGVPFVLAFITAFYTPEVGLSCRSFTFTIYACAELGQVLLWLWAYVGPSYNTNGPKGFFRSGGWLARHGFYDPRNVRHFFPSGWPKTPRAIWQGIISQDFRDLRFVWCCVWYALYIFFGTVATLSALGGTLMQLLGVYTADICQITVDDWIHPYRPGVTALISTNSRNMIRDAQIYWKPCAITAIAFMTFVSFVGWWYQRRMRDLFTNLVRDVDKDGWDRSDTIASKMHLTPQAETHFRDGRYLWGSPGI